MSFARRGTTHLITGRTLLEVLVGFVLIAIVGGVTHSSAITIRDGFLLSTESDLLAQTMREVHSRALESGIHHELVIEETGWLIADPFARDRGKTLKIHRYHQRVRGSVGRKSTAEISFFPSGVTSPRSVILKTVSATARITLSLRGRVTVTIE